MCSCVGDRCLSGCRFRNLSNIFIIGVVFLFSEAFTLLSLPSPFLAGFIFSTVKFIASKFVIELSTVAKHPRSSASSNFGPLEL